jgi:hypothetical protein
VEGLVGEKQASIGKSAFAVPHGERAVCVCCQRPTSPFTTR